MKLIHLSVFILSAISCFSDIKIEKSNVEMTTERLVLRSTRLEDKNFFYRFIYSQADVMKYDMDGDTLGFEWVDQKVNHLVSQWQSGELYGNFTICMKQADGSCGEPIGLIRVGDRETLGRSLPKGIAKMAYLLKKDVHGLGLGTEAATHLLYSYIPQLLKANTPLRGDGPLEAVVATVNPANLASVAILKNKLRMNQPESADEIQKYGKPYDADDQRFTFFLTADELLARSEN